MRGFPTILVSLCALLILLAQAVSGASITITQVPALYVSDYGEGVSHAINSYTLQPDQDVSGGAWMLLGTNDQASFARIDARKGISFLGWGAEQFNVANSGSYRWYYLYLQDGFPLGSNVQFHLHELTPAPAPTVHEKKEVEIVIDRAPLAVILDFSGSAPRVDHYNITSSETLPDSQSWQLLGTNNPDILGTDDPGAFTLLDDRSGIGFTGGVPEGFSITSPGSYEYYVFYLQDGFPVGGMNVGIELFEAEPTPTPTPTTTPTVTPTPTPAPLVVDFEGTPRAGAVPLSVTFTDKSTGSFANRSWDFGDGYTSSEENPVHTYTSAGVFTVKLTGCDAGGCSWYSRTSYIDVVSSGTPAPTETPRYYIRFGGGSGGSSSGGGTGSGGTGTGAGSAAGGTSGNSGEDGPGGPAGDNAGTGSSAGSGSTGSGQGQGSQGTGSTTGQGNPAQIQAEQQPGPQGIVEVLLGALGDITTTTGELLQYLQDRLALLFGW